MTTTHKDWRETFCGREAELDQLVTTYRDIKAGGGPRIVAVLGDRGIGKTRLVHEFYRRLAKPEFDPENYWPDVPLMTGNNVDVTPHSDLPAARAHYQRFGLSERRMPFLWWGFRLHDREDRNAARMGMIDHRVPLDFHLMERRLREEIDAASPGRREKDNLVDAGKKIAGLIPYVDAAINLFELWELYRKHGDERRQHEALKHKSQVDWVSSSMHQAAGVNERTILDLGALMGSENLPVIVYCDDAQLAGFRGEDGTYAFLHELWHRAVARRWPLMLIATHWVVDWNIDQRDQRDLCIASIFRQANESARLRIDLSPEVPFNAIVQAGLPDLPLKDQEFLLNKADGNPQLLVELISSIDKSPAWRNRDTGALEPHARDAIERTPSKLVDMIISRLENADTPEHLRQIAALSATQGMDFRGHLSTRAAKALGLPDAANALPEMHDPHYLASGIDADGEGVGHFVQKAARDAAMSMLGRHVGSEAQVEGVLLNAAIALSDAPDFWSATPSREAAVTLGVIAALGSKQTDQLMRQRAGWALLALAEQARNDGDPATACAYAEDFQRGIDASLWAIGDYRLEAILPASSSIKEWRGANAAMPLAEQMLEAARNPLDPDAIDTLISLSYALKHVSALNLAMGMHVPAETHLRELINVARRWVQRQPGQAASANLWFALGSLSQTLMVLHKLRLHNAESLAQLATKFARTAPTADIEPLRTQVELQTDAILNENRVQAAALLEEAIHLDQEAISLARNLHAAGKILPSAFATALVLTSNLRVAHGDASSALGYLRESLDLQRQTLLDDAHRIRREGFVDTLLRAAEISRGIDPKFHIECVTEALELSRPLVESTGTPTSRGLLADALLKHAALIEDDRPVEAESTLRECIALRRDLHDQDPSNMSHANLILGLQTLEQLQRARGLTQDADALAAQSQQAQHQHLLRSIDDESQTAYAGVIEAGVQHALTTGYTDAAQRSIQQAVEMRRGLLAKNSGADNQALLAASLQLAGDAAFARGHQAPPSESDLVEANTHYLDALQHLCEAFPIEFPPPVLGDVITLLSKIAQAYQALPRMDGEAERAYPFLLATYRIATEPCPPDFRNQMMITLDRLATASMREGFRDQAIDCYQIGADFSRSQALDHDDIPFQRDLLHWIRNTLALLTQREAEAQDEIRQHFDAAATQYIDEACNIAEHIASTAEPTISEIAEHLVWRITLGIRLIEDAPTDSQPHFQRAQSLCTNVFPQSIDPIIREHIMTLADAASELLHEAGRKSEADGMHTLSQRFREASTD